MPQRRQQWHSRTAFIMAAVLLVILVGNFIDEVTAGYAGYPRWATLVGGWGTVLFWAVLGYWLWKRPAPVEQR